MKIAMVASEINPLCKSGGLADVVYALSKELVVSGEEVICVLPFYKSIKDAATLKFARVGTFTVNVGWRRVDANVYKTYIDGILYYLIDNETYFGRDALYGYFDDGERFAFFTMAAAGLFEFVGFNPDVIHIHDWQPGMLPVVVREGLFPYVADSKFVLTIHNEAFQGMLDRYFLNDFYCLSDYLYDCGAVRFYDQVSTLKAAIVYCDKVTTVSPCWHRQRHRPRRMGSFFRSIHRQKLWAKCLQNRQKRLQNPPPFLVWDGCEREQTRLWHRQQIDEPKGPRPRFV